MKANILIFLVIQVSVLSSIFAQNSPYFNEGQDPSENGRKWKLVKKLSDEFEGGKLDEAKWMNTNPNAWIGRPPGIFKKDVVSLSDGKLMMTNYLLPEKEIVRGKEFTHAGAQLTSINNAQVGQYFECRMKANKTFMSSTFWLISDPKKLEDCDKRVTELDIQESVGEINTDAQWAQNFNKTMNSNTHSRNVKCDIPVGTIGGKASIAGKVYDDYHIFGAWWKSPTEILFFLDGNLVNTVNPVAEFSLPMYIKLVTETYNWNPVPEDGGMTGSMEDRTTYYDWVRTWQLK